MRFSLRRLFGHLTLACVALGAIMTVGPQTANPGEVIRGFLSVILIVEAVAALYAAGDPWFGYPTRLDTPLSAVAGAPVHTAVTMTLAALTGTLFLLIGGCGAMILVEGGMSMDPTSTSVGQWLAGTGLIVATVIGSFARGASLVGFLRLLCGTPLQWRWGSLFGLCGGSFVALLLWRVTGGVQGIVVSGVVGLLLLAIAYKVAVRRVGREAYFGRRARRWGARAFLLGLVVGALGAMQPFVAWLLFWRPPVSMLMGGMIGSSLGAVIGMLAGATTFPAPTNTKLPEEDEFSDGDRPFADAPVGDPSVGDSPFQPLKAECSD